LERDKGGEVTAAVQEERSTKLLQFPALKVPFHRTNCAFYPSYNSI